MRGLIDWIYDFLKWIFSFFNFFNKKPNKLPTTNLRTNGARPKPEKTTPRPLDTLPPKQLYAGTSFKFKPGKRDEALAVLYRGSGEDEKERNGPAKAPIDLVMTLCFRGLRCPQLQAVKNIPVGFK